MNFVSVILFFCLCIAICLCNDGSMENEECTYNCQTQSSRLKRKFKNKRQQYNDHGEYYFQEIQEPFQEIVEPLDGQRYPSTTESNDDENDNVLKAVRAQEDTHDKEIVYLSSVKSTMDEYAKNSSLMKNLGRFIKMKKDDEDEGKNDQNLKKYVGGHENQTPDEQSKTDGFFSAFKNKWGKRCFRDIGCFSAVTADWSSRPLPLFPMSPDDINPVFHLYTLENRAIPTNFSYNATVSELRNTTFDAKLRTAFIIHGFQSGYSLWMEHMKDFLFLQSNDAFNVVVVVWEKGSKIPSYNLAATNTRVVGALIAYFIDSLCQAFSVRNDRFWLIGHSLGAHTSGYAGKRLYNPKLWRITGLDPAGVSFHFKNTAMRLHSSDASVVDVIHTDSALHYRDGFGTLDNLGHYDFYPNGGNWQPGCPKSDGFKEKLNSLRAGEDITCSHSRACVITTNLDKPDDECSAVAYLCESYETFLEGRCADCKEDRCQLMGLNPNFWIDHSANTMGNTTYYINTAAQEEFCFHHYQFALHITKDSDAATGKMVFTVQTTETDGTVKDLSFLRIISRTGQNKIHTLLVTFDLRLNLTATSKMFVEWRRYNESERVRVNRGFKLKIPVIELNYMSSMNESTRDKYSMLYCPTNGEKTTLNPNKQKVEFVKCDIELITSARQMTYSDLVALTSREDLFAVDYKNQYPMFRKIFKSTISNVKQ